MVSFLWKRLLGFESGWLAKPWRLIVSLGFIGWTTLKDSFIPWIACCTSLLNFTVNVAARKRLIPNIETMIYIHSINVKCGFDFL